MESIRKFYVVRARWRSTGKAVYARKSGLSNKWSTAQRITECEQFDADERAKATAAARYLAKTAKTLFTSMRGCENFEVVEVTVMHHYKTVYPKPDVIKGLAEMAPIDGSSNAGE